MAVPGGRRPGRQGAAAGRQGGGGGGLDGERGGAGRRASFVLVQHDCLKRRQKASF